MCKLFKTVFIILVSFIPSLNAQTNGDAIIYPDNYVGNKIEHFYYDVKNGAAKVNTIAKANDLFVTDDMNGIRIPIYGNSGNDIHPSAGVVIASGYTSILNSVTNAQNARNGKDFYVFASKKLDGQSSFPAWTKDANGVIVSEYVKLLTDYILFMKSNGVEIDYLGIQNEEEYNEGNITIAKHKAIVDSIRVISVREGFKMPLIVGYEGYGPNKANWVGNLKTAGWIDRMDVYGTHYYPQFRPLSKLKKDLSYLGNIPFWSTEPHWDAQSDVDDWEEAEKGICTFWEQIEVGMSGFMWWGYSRDGNLRGNLMREFSVPLLGATMIDMNDIDGKGTNTYGKLQTRAFREDSIITVYAVNNSANSYDNYGFKLNTGYLDGSVSFRFWRKGSSVIGNLGTALLENNQTFRVSIPTYSIFSFSFKLSDTPTSVDETYALNEFKVYPSRVKSLLNIAYDDREMEYSIYNLSGIIVLKGMGTSVDVSNFTKGVYLIKSSDGKTAKFIKE